MQYQEYVSLSALTTMRLGGLARYAAEVSSREDLQEAVAFAREQRLPWFVLGGGSNVVALGDYEGLIILNRIRGFDKLAEDASSATYRLGAGEVWDSVVERLVREDLSGIEGMSGIPGYTGATPIQNVGAYGQEIANSLVELEVYDTETDSFVTLAAENCDFSYRNSIFKDSETRHWIICSITLRLIKEAPKPPFYPTLELYLSDNAITAFTPQIIRDSVIAIRASKLPDPLELASAGSFFKNPIVDNALADVLINRYPDAPHWRLPENNTKLAAGWLIETAGLKSYQAHGLQIYPKNALVVTNISAKSADDLQRFKTEIIGRVHEKFDITLEQEPEEI